MHWSFPQSFMVYKDGDTANLAYTFTKSRTFQEPNGLYQELYEPYALDNLSINGIFS